ncbi:MAG: hypothetical protein CND43_02805 [Flavobacteriales bacterium MED-G15]|nr:MAG: hypothetical protein CND43_02805 [Flavobacteriales bacterium MED-G15]
MNLKPKIKLIIKGFFSQPYLCVPYPVFYKTKKKVFLHWKVKTFSMFMAAGKDTKLLKVSSLWTTSRGQKEQISRSLTPSLFIPTRKL